MEALAITLDRQGSIVTLTLAHPCCAHNWFSRGWTVVQFCETTLTVARKPWRFLGLDDSWNNWSIETVGNWPALEEARLVNIDTGEVLEAKGLDLHRRFVVAAQEEGWSAAEFQAKVQAYEAELAKQVLEMEERQRCQEIDEAASERAALYGRER